jgi:hypothetical protein
MQGTTQAVPNSTGTAPPKLVAHADMLRRLPTQIVFDHLGHPPVEEGIRHPSHAVIRGMLDQRRAWVKVSGAYMNTNIGRARNMMGYGLRPSPILLFQRQPHLCQILCHL